MLHDDPRPSAASVDRAAELLKRAKRPLIVAGNGVNLARAQAELLAFAEATNIPVATTVTGTGAFPEAHRLSLGLIGRGATSGANPAGPVVDSLRQATAGENVSVVCDVGKHHKWIAQQFEARYGDAVVSSMGAATMGIGPCGAVGASLARPEAKTVAWTGDGGLTMVPFVLPTVAEYRMPIVFVVIDDGAYGAVANIQQARFGRTVYSEFTANGTNPGYKLDISRLSEACRIPARRITEAADIDRAMAWAFEQSGPALLDVIVDRKSVAPDGGGSKLAEIWKHPIHPWAARHVTAGSTRPALVAASEGKKGKP